MLNSKKLLYIFSDIAYIVELLPAKKKGDFSIQEFRQINGDFLDNNELIAANIEKLFSKIDAEEYTLVLPDFLFTNTIVEVKEKAKTKVDKYIDEKLLPSLEISATTHQIKHFVLTQYGDKSKVQLSALEKTLLGPIFESATKHEIKIASVVSLSWTVKSLVSLEPSLSVIQMGEQVYLAQHYIGIDQANYSLVTDIEKLGETIKTLKGAEPSIQTVYLLTNELVEEKLKDQLKATLPLQQLSDFKDDKSEIPSYVKQIIEAGAKTMSVADFSVPDFKLEKPPAQGESGAEVSQKSTLTKEENMAKKSSITDEKVITTEKLDEEKEALDETEEVIVSEDSEIISSEEGTLPEPSVPPTTGAVEELAETAEIEIEPENSAPTSENSSETFAATSKATTPEAKIATQLETSAEIEAEADTTGVAEDEAEIVVTDESGLSQFAAIEDEAESQVVSKPKSTVEKVVKINKDNQESKSKIMAEKKDSQPEVIKNKTGVSSMLKMVFISIAVFFVTVAVGVGLGLGFITLSQSEESEPTEIIAEVVPSPEIIEEASPTPSPEPEINKDEISILIVNATTKAGYASTIKKLLTTDEFTDVDAGNAKGDYEEGDYVLMTEENTALVELLSEATELDLEYSEEIKVEDVKGAYDAVIVLAK